jgi:hypothetical protein
MVLNKPTSMHSASGQPASMQSASGQPKLEEAQLELLNKNNDLVKHISELKKKLSMLNEVRNL